MLQTPWPDLSLPAKSVFLIAVPAAAAVLLFGAANMLVVRDTAATQLVDRSLQTSEEIQHLRVAEAEVSADTRAYFITAREPFMVRARSSLQALESSRNKLLDLTADGAVQQQRMVRIGAIELAREERMFGGIARFRSGAFPLDQLREELLRVDRERQEIENLLISMENDNANRTRLVRAQVASLRGELGAVTGVGMFCGLLGGVAMTLLFARGISNRLAGVQRNLARLANGSAPERLAGRDEIGALNQGLLRVAEVLRRKGLALDNALHGIAEVDAAGRYLWVNKTYAEMAGCSLSDRPTDIVATVQPEDRPRVEEAIAQMRTNGRAEIAARIDQLTAPAPDVGITFLSLSTAEDPVSSFYVFLRDSWAGQRADAALIRAKDAALASNRARTEFLARISHDIRTPLNAILGAADLLSQTRLSFDQGQYVSMFQRNCRRLVALINDFLDLSRIEAGALRVERVPFRIPETVDEAVATFREPTLRKGISLGVEIDPAVPAWALGDPLRIQQVLVNLLNNALKFTATGRVDVKVKVLKGVSAGDLLRYEICDSGPGIRLEDQEKIFTQFVQLPHQNNGQRGAGLGLTICRDLVELMGGEIGVISREGGGSTFHFSLPLEPAEAAPTDPENAECPAAQLSSCEPIRILVAEDTEDNRLLLEHFLRDQPVNLRIAQNGQEAVDAVQQGEQFDLILMDIDMPVMDGYTATRLIRTWQQSRSRQSEGLATPIVAWSADAMREAVGASLDAGCVAHVAKPMDRETLLKTIRRYAPANGVQDVPMGRKVAVAEQVKVLVPQYLASKEKQIEEARAALASHDFALIWRFAHNLKGTGRGYGFPVIEELGREIERAASEADASRISGQLDALHRFVDESLLAESQESRSGNHS
jgi:signal transduction histidine kinase/CheY-like chemotaxis protein/HPt (histidine-containing phosphotransfer) domain-containing protein